MGNAKELAATTRGHPPPFPNPCRKVSRASRVLVPNKLPGALGSLKKIKKKLNKQWHAPSGWLVGYRYLVTMQTTRRSWGSGTRDTDGWEPAIVQTFERHIAMVHQCGGAQKKLAPSGRNASLHEHLSKVLEHGVGNPGSNKYRYRARMYSQAIIDGAFLRTLEKPLSDTLLHKNERANGLVPCIQSTLGCPAINRQFSHRRYAHFRWSVGEKRQSFLHIDSFRRAGRSNDDGLSFSAAYL